MRQQPTRFSGRPKGCFTNVTLNSGSEIGTDGCGFDMCGLKYISHSHKFIYFEVPKTGSASLLKVFEDHASLTRLEGELYRFLEYPDYTKCTFVRNPWDRVLSCYLSKIKKDVHFNNENFENGVMKKFRKFEVFYAGMPFDEFLRAVEAIAGEVADGHFASQYRRITMNGEVVMDYVGRFENYRRDVKKFLRSVGIKRSWRRLPHINITKKREHYARHYNEETKQIVERRYKEDIALFDYQFEHR